MSVFARCVTLNLSKGLCRAWKWRSFEALSATPLLVTLQLAGEGIRHFPFADSDAAG